MKKLFTFNLELVSVLQEHGVIPFVDESMTLNILDCEVGLVEDIVSKYAPFAMNDYLIL